MTGTLLRIGWINLKRDRVVQALTFLLPILFFSIFASVFGNQRDPTRRIAVAVVDEDGTDFSRALVVALTAEGGLRVRTTAAAPANGPAPLLDRAGAEALVRAGTVPVAVILPKGLAATRRFLPAPDATPAATVQVLADVSDPVAPQMVQGLLQKVAFTAAPQALALEGMAMFEQFGGPLTPAQQQARDQWTAQMQSSPAAAAGAGPAGLPTTLVNVLKPDQGDTATISYYAAGVGVMFLLFSCAGAGGTLLDEEEAGTLERVISSRVGMTGLLMGKWLLLTLMGVAQLTLMFTWGALMFALPLVPHLAGFFVMTAFTAAAAAGFGLVLATLSRTRAQLSGLSTILILTMSALGGSMFPRFMMSDTMQQVGLVTFNAWALDGYLKVFWREAPLVALWPQLLVLGALTAVFLGSARLLARRWEAV